MTMAGALEIVHPGIGTTVQDAGRQGQRHQGLPLAGWLDAPLAEASNALLGNAAGAAVLELRGMGLQLRVVDGPVQLALAGNIAARWQRPDGSVQTLPPWQTATLRPGDLLQPGPPASGCAYLAVAGGITLAPQLGARASFWRAGLSGPLGRPLLPGDRLPCGGPAAGEANGHAGSGPGLQHPFASGGAEHAGASLAGKPLGGESLGIESPGSESLGHEWQAPEPWQAEPGPIRVLWGPQDDHFQPEALRLFERTDWQATALQDRMGLRFAGPALAHTSAAAADIVSDAATPGTIQVPANGQPIVLLADCQTVGGYPKIATVIRADLPRLAHLPAGSVVRFQAVDHAAARAALLQQHARWQAWVARRRPHHPPGRLDIDALYAANLVSGMVDAGAR